MKVTVCELSNAPADLEREWQELVSHVKSAASSLVLLPEMPFSPWPAYRKQADAAAWQEAVAAHDRWLPRLKELSPAVAAGTRPVTREGKHFNEGFIWSEAAGYQGVHDKYYLPDEAGFWEATWYERGSGEFSLTQSGDFKIGFLICTEMWFNARARDYCKQGINILVCPRATPKSTVDKWIAGGRTAAVVSGAFCLSANFGHSSSPAAEWGGSGWIIEPEEGSVLAITSAKQPFATAEIDLKAAESAKKTYPRYVPD